MARAAASMGRMVPTSLLTAIMLTSVVSGRTASRTASGAIWPSRSGWSQVTSQPSFSSWRTAFATDGCSICVVMMWLPLFLRA